MKRIVKFIFIIGIIIIYPYSTIFAYIPDLDEVECSSDVNFGEYQCTKCYDWWEKGVWNYIDLNYSWINNSNIKEIIYLEEIHKPKIINLGGISVIFKKIKENYYSYTDDFKNKYTSLDEWYVLEPWKSVELLNSWKEHSFEINKNTVPKWKNIWLLVFWKAIHYIYDDWEIDIENRYDYDCVLYKSWKETEYNSEVSTEKINYKTTKEIQKTYIKSKRKIFKDLILSNKEIKKTIKWKKDKTKFDKLIPLVSDEKLIDLHERLENIDTNLSKFKKYKALLEYLKAKIWIEIYSRDSIEKEEI